jgi:pimeloyl-ACP methyl ester carboxylesterase
MLPSDLLQAAFILFVAAPVVAAILAFKGPPVLRQIARIVLLGAWLAQAAATIACLRYAFGQPSSGIGNEVLLFVAIPTALFAVVWFGFWRAARRHEYVQSLPSDLRRVEELADIERGLEAANKDLASMERRVESWGISSDERNRLRLNIATMKGAIATLEQERAKRM